MRRTPVAIAPPLHPREAHRFRTLLVAAALQENEREREREANSSRP